MHSSSIVSQYLVSVLYRLVKENGIYNNNCDKRLILPSFLLNNWSLFASSVIFNLQILFRMDLVNQNAYVLATSAVGMKTINNS